MNEPIEHKPLPLLMGERARLEGLEWEHKVCQLLKQAGYLDLIPSQGVNDYLDSKGVDIIQDPTKKPWVKFPFHVQCKVGIDSFRAYPKYLTKMPRDKTPVIFFQQVREVEGEIKPRGSYAILRLEDFLYLINADPF